MSEQHQPLWSDSRIIQALSDGGFDHDNWLIAKLTMEVIRDEYEAELAAVRGQLARCSELYDKRKGEMWQLEQDLDALAAEVERLRAEPRYVPLHPAKSQYIEIRDDEYQPEYLFRIGTHPSGNFWLEISIPDEHQSLMFGLPDGHAVCSIVPAQDTQQQDGQ